MPSLRSSTTMPTPYRRLRPRPRSGGSRPIGNRLYSNSELGAQLALAAAAAGGTLAEFGEESLPARDWLAENQLSFPPLRVGRFFVYGSHHDGKVPAGAIGIAIDAATAFGTGEHPSTRGCLLALERLARRRQFRRPLDIGTGTGILSIAAAKLLHRKVLAGDIDPRAICVARHNAARNGVRRLVQSRKRAGLPRSAHSQITLRSGPVQYPRAPIGGDGRRSLSPVGSRRTRRVVGITAMAGADRARTAPWLRHSARSSAGHRRVVDPGNAPPAWVRDDDGGRSPHL